MKLFNKHRYNPQLIEMYLNSVGMPNKAKLSDDLWKAFERTRDRTWDITNPETKRISLTDATKFINLNTPDNIELSSDQVKVIVDKNYLRHDKIESGKDSLGRSIVDYQVVLQDVQNFCDLLKVWQEFEKLNLTKEKKHPDTGTDVIEYYVPTTQFKLRRSKAEILGMVSLELLSKPFVIELIEELKRYKK